MNQTVINYHKQRRPFIIIPETGLILGETGQPFSHREILSRCGLDDEQVKYVLENYPRGYFLDNKLVIYQREDVEEGSCWELKPENYFYVRKYFPGKPAFFWAFFAAKRAISGPPLMKPELSFLNRQY